MTRYYMVQIRDENRAGQPGYDAEGWYGHGVNPDFEKAEQIYDAMHKTGTPLTILRIVSFVPGPVQVEISPARSYRDGASFEDYVNQMARLRRAYEMGAMQEDHLTYQACLFTEQCLETGRAGEYLKKFLSETVNRG